MGVISAGNNNEFKSATYIYSKVLRFLNSFNAANLIDEGEFPTYTKEVLNLLGSGAYIESQAVVPIINYTSKVPDNFKYLYSAYKCTPFERNSNKGDKLHLQPSSFGFITEVSKTLTESNGCEILCCEKEITCTETLSINNYVKEADCTWIFRNITPLRLSPNVQKDICIGDHADFLNTSMYEISINNRILSTNFTDDCVYIKYYGFPIDEDGNILIPAVEALELAIQWYIIYQILLQGYYNSSIPDIQNKAQDAETRFNKYFAQAKYLAKLPSFADMVNAIRTKRGLNKMVFFTGQPSNTNFQRTR